MICKSNNCLSIRHCLAIVQAATTSRTLNFRVWKRVHLTPFLTCCELLVAYYRLVVGWSSCYELRYEGHFLCRCSCSASELQMCFMFRCVNRCANDLLTGLQSGFQSGFAADNAVFCSFRGSREGKPFRKTPAGSSKCLRIKRKFHYETLSTVFSFRFLMNAFLVWQLCEAL